MVRRKPTLRGFTVPEVLVSSFIVLLMGAMFALVLRQTRAQSYRSDALLTSRQASELLFKTLGRDFEKTTVDGVHLSQDGDTLSLQTVERISLNGRRAWSPSVSIYHFDKKKEQLLRGQAELAEIGITHQPDVPAALSEEELNKFVQKLDSNKKWKAVGAQLDRFAVERPTPLTIKVEIKSVLQGGKYKNEELDTERTFFFASATEL